MSVELTRDGDAVLVTVHGDFDVRVAHEPYEAVSALFESGEHVSSIVVDLGGVEFADSTGLGGLIRLQHEADAHGVPVRLRQVHRRLAGLFAITGLTHEFAIEQAAPES